MATDQGGVDDMVELAEISEKAIATNLHVRLKKETIYVSNISTATLYLHLVKDNQFNRSQDHECSTQQVK